MKMVKMTSGRFTFTARLEEEKSPETCKWLLKQLPWDVGMIQVIWSGKACFMPLGDMAFGLPDEHMTRIPSKGEIIVYPGNVPHLQWDGEFFMSCGPCSIATQMGHLYGNLVLTIVEGIEDLEEFSNEVQYKGEQIVHLELMGD
ncbi:DUF3830 family protein [Lachnospiraceae bacterium 62-35]